MKRDHPYKGNNITTETTLVNKKWTCNVHISVHAGAIDLSGPENSEFDTEQEAESAGLERAKHRIDVLSRERGV
jgi:hypothetical protein